MRPRRAAQVRARSGPEPRVQAAVDILEEAALGEMGVEDQIVRGADGTESVFVLERPVDQFVLGPCTQHFQHPLDSLDDDRLRHAPGVVLLGPVVPVDVTQRGRQIAGTAKLAHDGRNDAATATLAEGPHGHGHVAVGAFAQSGKEARQGCQRRGIVAVVAASLAGHPRSQRGSRMGP